MFDVCSPWSFLLLDAAAAAGTMTGAEPESCRCVRNAHLLQDTYTGFPPVTNLSHPSLIQFENVL